MTPYFTIFQLKSLHNIKAENVVMVILKQLAWHCGQAAVNSQVRMEKTKAFYLASLGLRSHRPKEQLATLLVRELADCRGHQ